MSERQKAITLTDDEAWNVTYLHLRKGLFWTSGRHLQLQFQLHPLHGLTAQRCSQVFASEQRNDHISPHVAKVKNLAGYRWVAVRILILVCFSFKMNFWHHLCFDEWLLALLSVWTLSRNVKVHSAAYFSCSSQVLSMMCCCSVSDMLLCSICSPGVVVIEPTSSTLLQG